MPLRWCCAVPKYTLSAAKTLVEAGIVGCRQLHWQHCRPQCAGQPCGAQPGSQRHCPGGPQLTAQQPPHKLEPGRQQNLQSGGEQLAVWRWLGMARLLEEREVTSK